MAVSADGRPDSRVIIYRFTRKSRGFGFVKYENAAWAEDALVGMNGVYFDGRNVRVDRANAALSGGVTLRMTLTTAIRTIISRPRVAACGVGGE